MWLLLLFFFFFLGLKNNWCGWQYQFTFSHFRNYRCSLVFRRSSQTQIEAIRYQPYFDWKWYNSNPNTIKKKKRRIHVQPDIWSTSPMLGPIDQPWTIVRWSTIKVAHFPICNAHLKIIIILITIRFEFLTLKIGVTT